MEVFEVETKYSHCDDCVLIRSKYVNNDHIAISVYSLADGPFASITVNLESTYMLPNNFGYVDTNNFPEAAELIERLGIGKPTGLNGVSGFCVYPIYEFDEEAIRKYAWRNWK